MHASARGWREQDRAAKRLILMRKTLLMVMFKTSKLRLTEKKHLHADEVEQMSSLESVKVRRRRRNAARLTAAFPREQLEKLRFRNGARRSWYGPGWPPIICPPSKLRHPPPRRTTTNLPSFWSAPVQSANYEGSSDETAHAAHSPPDWTCDKRGHAARGDAELITSGWGLICMDFLL